MGPSLSVMSPIASKVDDEAPTDEFGPDGDYPFESDDLWSK